MRPQDVGKFLDIAARRQEAEVELRREQQKANERMGRNLLIFLFGVCLLVAGLCWLFLHYDKTDQVFNLIAMLFAGGGGVGIGLGGNRVVSALRGPRIDPDARP